MSETGRDMSSRAANPASPTVPARPEPGRLLIDGKLCDALTGATYTAVNPATEETLPPCADGGAEDASVAGAAPRRCFDETDWVDDAGRRRRCLEQLLEALQRHHQEFRKLLVDEVGVPVS